MINLKKLSDNIADKIMTAGTGDHKYIADRIVLMQKDGMGEIDLGGRCKGSVSDCIQEELTSFIDGIIKDLGQ